MAMHVRNWMCCFLFFLCSLTVSAQGTITFTFKPPDGLKYIETRSTKTEITAPQKVTAVTTRDVQITMKKTDKGYSCAMQPLTMSATMDGRAQDTKINEAICNSTVTYLLDEKGFFRSAIGYHELVEKISKLMPAAQRDAVAKQYNPKELEEDDRADWQQRMEVLIGRTVKPGDDILAVSVWSTPLINRLPLYVVSTVSGTGKEDGRNLVKLKIAEFSDPAAAAKASGKSLAALAKELKLDKAKLQKPEGIQVTGTGERLLDPQTMVTYSEKTTRTLDAVFEDEENKKMKIHLVETYSRIRKGEVRSQKSEARSQMSEICSTSPLQRATSL